MPVTIILTRQPLDATQQGSLRTLFDSPAFSLFKELVASRCVDKQVFAMNAALYPNNEAATNDAANYFAEASGLSALLDIIDDLVVNEDDWWTVKIEPRR